MRHDTFIVARVEELVRQAKKISIFYWVEKIFWPLSFALVDFWTISFLVASFGCFCLVLFTSYGPTQIIVLTLSAVRVFEYLNYLLWVILFARPNKGKTDLRSYRRTLLLMMSNYLETIFWFATWLAVLAACGSLNVTQGPVSLAVLREAVMLMVANWSGNLSVTSSVGIGIVAIQDVIGLFMTIVVGARVISLLPRPSSADPNEKGRNRN